MRERAGILHRAAEVLGAVVCDADADEHDREGFSAFAPAAVAFCAISTASRSCGRPPPENNGSFCPRTRLFIRSSAVNAGLDEIARQRRARPD